MFLKKYKDTPELVNLLALDEYINKILNGQELASGNINYRVIPTYFPVSTTFLCNYRDIPTALSLTSFSRKCANPDIYILPHETSTTGAHSIM